MSRIFFDTNLFIYFFENRSPWGEEVARLLSRMRQRHDTLVTSTLTLGELLVKPKELGDFAMAQRYVSALKAPGVELVPFEWEAAERYSDIRQDRSIKGPDAIQLACAAAVGCDLFVTNDESLSRKNVTGIQFIVPLSRVPI